MRRRLSALSSFYRYCAAGDLIGRVSTDGVGELRSSVAYQVTFTLSSAVPDLDVVNVAGQEYVSYLGLPAR